MRSLGFEKSDFYRIGASLAAASLVCWLAIDDTPVDRVKSGYESILHSDEDDGTTTTVPSASVNFAAGSPNMPCSPGEIIYGVETQEPVIAITIDDGPSLTTTRANLAVAKKYGAKLTLFPIANRVLLVEGQNILKEALADGHEVDTHSYSHTLGDPSVNADQQQLAVGIFQNALGFVPYANRAPGLAVNEALLQATILSGQCFIDISEGSDTKDWQCDFADSPAIAQAGIERRASQVSMKPGSILLMHDEMTDTAANGGRNRARATSPYELELLLQRAAALGLRTVTVSELLKMGPHINSAVPDNSQSDC